MCGCWFVAHKCDKVHGSSPVNRGAIVEKGTSCMQRSARRVASWGAVRAVVAFVVCGLLVGGAHAAGSDGQTMSDASGEDSTNQSGAAGRAQTDTRMEAARAVSGIEDASRDIGQQLQGARRERDVVRVLCLGDKLGQVDVALRSARTRMEALGIALGRQDADRAQHESIVLEVLADRVRDLVGESSQCVGEETGFIGDAKITVSINPNLPDDDSGDGALSAFPVLAPPSIGSAID